MESQQFEALQYGNTIQDRATGEKFIVLHVVRDEKTGHAQHVGILPALDANHARCFDVICRRSSETYIAGRTIPAPPLAPPPIPATNEG